MNDSQVQAPSAEVPTLAVRYGGGVPAKLNAFDQRPEYVERGFILVEFEVPAGSVFRIGHRYRIEVDETSAPPQQLATSEAARHVG